MWRGPMLHRALEQFLTDVHWGEIDTLVVDMPPGTGDVSISLGQLLAARRGRRRDDAAEARAGRRGACCRRWRRRRTCGSSASSRTCRATSSAAGAERSSPAISACRSSARCRSIPCCASRATRARRSSPRSPMRSRRARSWRSPQEIEALRREPAGDRQGAAARRMSAASELVEEAYACAKRSDHRTLRELHRRRRDVGARPRRSMEPVPRPRDRSCGRSCWRAGLANTLRPGETIELGDRVRLPAQAARASTGSAASGGFMVAEAVPGRRGAGREDRPGCTTTRAVQEALAAAGHES